MRTIVKPLAMAAAPAGRLPGLQRMSNPLATQATTGSRLAGLRQTAPLAARAISMGHGGLQRARFAVQPITKCDPKIQGPHGAKGCRGVEQVRPGGMG